LIQNPKSTCTEKGFERYCLRLSRLFFIVYRDQWMATHESDVFEIQKSVFASIVEND
jgi:hypothetical protein